MKAVIDIGSNSVRLAIFSDGSIIYRDKITAVLAEDLSKTGLLSERAMERNLAAINTFVNTSLNLGLSLENIKPFATAAVRRAKNGADFCRMAKEKFRLTVKVLSEEEECLAAFYGALSKKDGAVLDVGGASSELIKVSGGKVVYAKSLADGAVTIFDRFSEDEAKIEDYLNLKLSEFFLPKIDNLTIVGGTATCLAYIISGDKVYDRDKNHGRFVPITDLYAHLCQLKPLSPSKRAEVCNIEPSRARTIYSGGILIYVILKTLGLNGYTVSEKDNLEGFYSLYEDKL